MKWLSGKQIAVTIISVRKKSILHLQLRFEDVDLLCLIMQFDLLAVFTLMSFHFLTAPSASLRLSADERLKAVLVRLQWGIVENSVYIRRKVVPRSLRVHCAGVNIFKHISGYEKISGVCIQKNNSCKQTARRKCCLNSSRPLSCDWGEAVYWRVGEAFICWIPPPLKWRSHVFL